MRVLIVNTSEKAGGAAVAANRLMDALNNNGVKAKLGALLAKDALKSVASRFDTAKYGGAVLLGLNSPVVKQHGRSDARAVYYAVKQIDKILTEDLTNTFKQEFSK